MEDKKDILPNIKGISKELPFKVPENYFVGFPEKIKSRIDELPLKKEAQKSTLKKLIPVFYSAAAVILLILGVIIALNYNASQQLQAGKTLNSEIIDPHPVNTQIATAEIVEEFDENFIIDYYTDYNITTSDSVTSDDLQDYIADNIDINTIIDNY